MEWYIQSDFDPGDETVHFGTRAFAEGDGCVYEVTTAAIFQSASKVTAVPKLNFGYLPHGAVCVCVGNSLTVFADESGSSLLFNMAFDAEIETFSCSHDGNFLFVGLSNGFLQCLHIPSEGEVVYAKKFPFLARNGRMFVKLFIDDKFPHDVLIVSTSGIVNILWNFDFSSLHSALDKGNSSEVKELVSQICTTPLCGISAIAPICSASFIRRNNQAMILAVGEGIATLSTGAGPSSESKDLKWLECPSENKILKLQGTSDNGLFVALDASGQLLYVCPNTLMMCRIPSKNSSGISDFQLVGSSTSEALIITITSPSENKQSKLCMFSIVGFCEKFSLPIEKNSVLMSSNAQLNVEDIHFLEYSSNKTTETSTVALKAATQTVPKFRLERLLTRKKFEAAEALAKNFGLDMAPIHITRARCLLDQMQPWNRTCVHTPEDNKDLLKRLFDELDKIGDLDFVSNCCVSAVPPDFHVAYSLLEYAQQRLETFFVANPESENKFLEWSANVCSSILRLETLNLLRPSWDVEEWLEFSRVDLFQEVQAWIKKGNLSEASVIWSRHKSSLKCRLGDERIVYSILEDIPTWVSLDSILEWLAHLLPSVLEIQPNCLANIVSWMLCKISGLERTNPKEWPKISLDYTERTLQLMSTQNFASPFVGVEASPLRPLVVLRCALADLQLLRSKFYIFLSLEEYSQPPSDVALSLLDYIDVGSISTFIKQYFNNYVLDHKLEGDLIISAYVKCVLQNSDGWWYWEEAPWELRIATLIPHVTNYTMRLECINATLEMAPVPWSPLITGLAEDGLKLKHPLSSLIREKQKQVGTNLILKKYGLKSHINKIDRKRLLKYIVKQNHPEMMLDLVELAQKSIDDYITIILQFFYNGDTSRAIEVLRNLPNDMIVQICPCLIHQASMALDLPCDCNIENHLEFISVVAMTHEAAIKSKPSGLSYIEDLNNPRDLPLSLDEIKNRFLLKRDFGRYVTMGEIKNVLKREKVLNEIVGELLKVENKEPSQRKRHLYHQLVYLARLLMVPTAVALLELVEQAMIIPDIELASYVAGCFHDLDGLPSKAYKRLIKLPSLFLSKLQCLSGKDKNVQITQEASAVVYDVASKVCSSCNTDQFIAALAAFGWTRVWRVVSGQQELSSIGQRDAFLNWRFTPLYKDPGMAGLLSGSTLSNFLYSAFDYLINVGDLNHSFISELQSSVKKLQNDQHDIAALMILSLVRSSLQRFSRTNSASVVPLIDDTLMKCFQTLLTKVAGARQLDKCLSLSLLSYMGPTKALTFLEQMCKSAQIDFHRQKAFSCLGTIVSSIWKNSSLHSFFQHISIQSTWGLRLLDLDIPAKELLRGRADAANILHKLMGSKNVNSSLLQALCFDFQLDYQDVLLQHICAILLSWDPDPIINVNPDGSKDVIERNTQQQLFEQCWELQKNIKNKTLLCNTLCSTWEKVNFYHHEVFIVILEILEGQGVEKQTNKRLITQFLKKYRRVKSPDQAEEEFWAEIFPLSFNLPPMSEFRLPYNRRLTDTPFLVIKREINLNTYKNWLSIAAALDLPKDKICTIAVHQTVTEEFSGCQNTTEWCNTLKHDALIKSIAKCVAEMDDVVLATATLYFFMNKIPSGYDQMEVANLCLQYAEIVVTKTGESEHKIKIEKKFLHLATLQTLHMFGLGQPCYLQLASKPVDLIHALYQHPSILDLCRGNASHSLDINAAVKEIAAFHGICVKSLHMNLVSEWLQPDIVVDCNTSLDEDIFRGLRLNRRNEQNHHQDSSSNFCSADDNILRARYIMQFGDVEQWASFLISLVYADDVCLGMRLRAMQCLCVLTDDETLEELSGRTVSSIREKLRTLKYLKDLEILGLTYSESSFESCDKKELAHLILRTQTRSPRAVALLVQLCVDYKVSSMSLWTSMLQQLMNLPMLKELEQALSHTSEMYQLWNLSTFRKAWNLLLTSPFSEASQNSKEETESAMLHSLTLFPTCPIMKHIDVTSALENCLAIQRPDIASLLLPYVEKCEVPQWLNKILSLKEVKKLSEDIKRITSGRDINASKVLSMLPCDAT